MLSLDVFAMANSAGTDLCGDQGNLVPAIPVFSSRIPLMPPLSSAVLEEILPLGESSSSKEPIMRVALSHWWRNAATAGVTAVGLLSASAAWANSDFGLNFTFGGPGRNPAVATMKA